MKMRFWMSGLAILAGSVACVHGGNRAPSSRAPATATVSGAAEQVLAYFNKGLKDQGDRNQANRVSYENSRYVAVDAKSKHVAGHWIEDCRKVAIRQVILDVTQDGSAFGEISRKGSHRLSLVKPSQDRFEDVGAIVGVRLTTAGGQAQETSFSYTLEDDSSGYCDFKSFDGQKPGMSDRRSIEAMVLNEYWPGYDAKRKEEMIALQQRLNKDASPAAITAKSVGKLIEWECEQATINKAAQLAQESFRAQFQKQPILFLDFKKSDVVSNLNEDNRTGKLEKMNGFWVFRMADASGTNLTSVKVSFDVQEKDGKCVGNLPSKAEAFAL